jgi:hypothetical protein
MLWSWAAHHPTATQCSSEDQSKDADLESKKRRAQTFKWLEELEGKYVIRMREFQDQPSIGPYFPERLFFGRITLNW